MSLFGKKVNYESKDETINQDSISEKIDKIIEKRKENLPILQQKKGSLAQLKTSFLELNSNLIDAKDSLDEDIDFSLFTTQRDEIDNLLSKTIAKYDDLLRRFNRETINLGVAGNTGQGKSLLLQKISGLTDIQIPSGSDFEMTATKSLIFNSSENYGLLDFHTWESFFETKIKPLLDEAEIPKTLNSQSDFFSYNFEGEGNGEIIQLLKNLQKHKQRYLNELTGGIGEKIKLQDLTDFVSYPDDGSRTGKCLAVKKADIYTKFPDTSVKKLALIDLPGIGGIRGKGIYEKLYFDAMHINCDIVLFLKRVKKDDRIDWNSYDRNMLNSVKNVSKSIGNTKDFIFIILNNLADDDNKNKKAYDNITELVNNGTANQNYNVLQSCVADQSNVKNKVLNPVLEHLSETLSKMDFTVLENLNEEIKQQVINILNFVNDLERKIMNSIPQNTDTKELLHEKARNLTTAINSSIGQIIKDCIQISESKLEIWLNKPATEEEEDIDFEEIEVDNNTDKWFHKIKNESDKHIRKIEMSVEQFQSKISAREMTSYEYRDKIISEIQRQWSSLGNEFEKEIIEKKYNEIIDSFSKHIGNFKDRLDFENVKTGREKLILLADEFEKLEPPCLQFSDSLKQLSKINFFNKYISMAIVDYYCEKELPVYNNTSMSDKDYLAELSDRAEVVNYKVEQALVTKLSHITYGILTAAIKDFKNKIVRLEDGKKDFRNLTNQCAMEIWPDEFANVKMTNDKVNKLKKSLKTTKENLNNLNN